MKTNSRVQAKKPRNTDRKIRRTKSTNPRVQTKTARNTTPTQSTTPRAAAEKAHNTYRKTASRFEEIGRDEGLKAAPAFAEQNLAQTQEGYERSKDALEGVLESWERFFDAVGQGVMALNRKVRDITDRNVISGFDLAKSLTRATNLPHVMELQAAHWRKQLSALTAQAEEVQTLSTRVAADVAEPIKSQMTRGLDVRTP